MKNITQSTLKDIKRMFASEHVKVIGSLFGTQYIDAHTGKPMSKRKALRILAGDY